MNIIDGYPSMNINGYPVLWVRSLWVSPSGSSPFGSPLFGLHGARDPMEPKVVAMAT